jgi:hypothetical protein
VYPKINEFTPPGACPTISPNLIRPKPNSGQIIEKIKEMNIIEMKTIIGINLTPEKKLIACGSWIFLNLLYRIETTYPTIIPPKTEVCNEVIPTFEPKIASN